MGKDALNRTMKGMVSGLLEVKVIALRDLLCFMRGNCNASVHAVEERLRSRDLIDLPNCHYQKCLLNCFWSSTLILFFTGYLQLMAG